MRSERASTLWDRYGTEPVMRPWEVLERDGALYEDLRRAEFKGRLAAELHDELWRYGWNVLRGWMKDGTIAARCAAAGFRMVCVSAESDAMQASAELREDLAAEAVPLAVDTFMNEHLPEGVWKPDGGASMRTFFMSSCLFRFRTAFNAWARPRRRELYALAERIHRLNWEQPNFEEQLAQRDTLQRIVAASSAEAGAIIGLLWTEPRTYKEVGEQLQLTVRSVEGHMRRVRTTAQAMRRRGEIEVSFLGGPASGKGRRAARVR